MATKVIEATKDVAEEVVSSDLEMDEEVLEEENEARVYIPTGIFVKREMYDKTTKRYRYFTSMPSGRTKDITCNFIPADLGAYDQLDNVFFNDKGEGVELYKTPYSIKDDNGNVVSGYSYYVRDYDATLSIWFEAKIKPSKSSDKGNLETIEILKKRITNGNT